MDALSSSGERRSAAKLMKSSQVTAPSVPGMAQTFSESMTGPASVKLTSAVRKLVPPASMTAAGSSMGRTPSAVR